MRRALLALTLAASCFSTSIEAAEPEHAAVDCQTRPSWCVAGYSCAPTSCVVELRVRLEEALADLRAARRQARRLHVDATCGPAPFATALTEDYGLHAFPAPLACVVGLAVRIGRGVPRADEPR